MVFIRERYKHRRLRRDAIASYVSLFCCNDAGRNARTSYSLHIPLNSLVLPHSPPTVCIANYAIFIVSLVLHTLHLCLFCKSCLNS